MSDNTRNTESGRGFFGEKDLQYLKGVSRQAIEKHTNTSVLYFEVDYENSRRNFYGEMTAKHFVDPQGVEVKGVIDTTQSDSSSIERVPNKLALLKFSCYVDHLRELDIEPRIGDFLATKNRVYRIHDRTLLDANKVQIAVDREAYSIEYDCVEVDDEEMLPDLSNFNQDRGTKDDIQGRIEPQK